MEILKSLGVNSTLWIQLVCFLVSYLALHFLILKPYSAALRERENRTIGNQENAVRIIDEANELQADFEKKAKSINSEIKKAFDQSRSEATKEYDRLVESARGEAEAVLAEARTQISGEIKSAKTVLVSEVPNVSAAIASKLAGKEISL